jgi:hypothetical protein
MIGKEVNDERRYPYRIRLSPADVSFILATLFPYWLLSDSPASINRPKLILLLSLEQMDVAEPPRDTDRRSSSSSTAVERPNKRLRTGCHSCRIRKKVSYIIRR